LRRGVGGGMGIVFAQIKDSLRNSPDRAGMLVSAALVTDNFTTNATFLVGKVREAKVARARSARGHCRCRRRWVPIQS